MPPCRRPLYTGDYNPNFVLQAAARAALTEPNVGILTGERCFAPTMVIVSFRHIRSRRDRISVAAEI